MNHPKTANGSVAAPQPKTADRLRTRRILAAGVPTARTAAKRRFPPSTMTASEDSAATNGSEATALALPPMEMTSCGQPSGLPTGLAQPTDGSHDTDRSRGLSTFPQALPLKLELKDLNNDNVNNQSPSPSWGIMRLRG